MKSTLNIFITTDNMISASNAELALRDKHKNLDVQVGGVVKYHISPETIARHTEADGLSHHKFLRDELLLSINSAFALGAIGVHVFLDSALHDTSVGNAILSTLGILIEQREFIFSGHYVTVGKLSVPKKY